VLGYLGVTEADSLDEEDRKRAEEENMQRAVRAISTMYFTEEELKVSIKGKSGINESSHPRH
jgi:hypothetical protein